MWVRKVYKWRQQRAYHLGIRIETVSFTVENNTITAHRSISLHLVKISYTITFKIIKNEPATIKPSDNQTLSTTRPAKPY